jgi:hypothetical protein
MATETFLQMARDLALRAEKHETTLKALRNRLRTLIITSATNEKWQIDMKELMQAVEEALR